MKVLIACEFSGIVREEFRKRGHDAWSCDLLPTEIKGKHYQGDISTILSFGWDLLIAHPPCTYLCRNNAKNAIKHKRLFTESYKFFNNLKGFPCEKICIENPVPHRHAKVKIGQYTQIIQPWQFGHDYSKKTCLWLQNLPPLKPTKIVKVSHIITKGGHRYTKGWYEMPRNSKDRSRTFQGIAKAMAEQWG